VVSPRRCSAICCACGPMRPAYVRAGRQSLDFAVVSASLPGVSLNQSEMQEVSANHGSDTALINST
jgi:hypothetical protein